MMHPEIQAMLQEKGQICISVIIPTHRLPTESQANEVRLDKILTQVEEYLYQRCEPEEASLLLERLHELTDPLDAGFMTSVDGIGLYVSVHVQKLVRFSYPVREKVLIADSFQIRDLVYELAFEPDYYLLQLSEKEVRLYKGHLNDLQEIQDEHFPKEYQDAYDYQKSGPGKGQNGYAQSRSVEKDKSELKHIREQDFFRTADQALPHYLTADTPLMLAGTPKALSLFEEISTHMAQIAGVLHGNYAHAPLQETASRAWAALKTFVEKNKDTLLKDLEEKIGTQYGIDGVKNVWKAAREGRGLQLVVEKDFTLPGFLEEDGDHLHLKPPRKAHTIIPDLVDDIAEMVLEKGGDVMLVANDTLKDHERIALITRY